MKKTFAVFAMVCALALFVGCAEEPVEEELVTDETEETLEEAVPEGTTELTPETGPDPMMDDTSMTDTTMTDTTMTDTMNETASENVLDPEVE